MDVHTFKQTCLCESLLHCRANWTHLSLHHDSQEHHFHSVTDKMKPDATEYTLSDLLLFQLQDFSLAQNSKFISRFCLTCPAVSSCLSSHSNRDSDSTIYHPCIMYSNYNESKGNTSAAIFPIKFKVQQKNFSSSSSWGSNPNIKLLDSLLNKVCETVRTNAFFRRYRKQIFVAKCCIRATLHIPAPTLHWVDAFPQFELNR